MHRTHAGGLLAVVLPGALALHWTLALPVAIGLALTRSLTGWIAAIVGLAVLWPALGWLLALLLLVSVWIRHSRPPGAIIDTTRARLLTWLYLLRTWSWRGGDVRLACEAAHIRSGGQAMDGGPARNEALQVAYRYGSLGVVALLGLGAVILPSLQWGDPVSAMLVSAGLVLSATSPLTAFRRWLAGGDGPIFGPPLRASLTLHIDAEGRAHLYGAEAADRALQVWIARSLFCAGTTWMTRHDLSITEVQGDGQR
jgi:hypothetical protein